MPSSPAQTAQVAPGEKPHGESPGTPGAPAARTPPARQSFALADAWWPLGHRAEITTSPVPVLLGARSLAVYRDHAGIVCALADRCPHRRLPLSLGRVNEQGLLQCGYHGWAFDGRSGQCALIPNFRPGEKPSSRIAVAAFPVVETGPFALAWTGGTATAPPAPGWLDGGAPSRAAAERDGSPAGCPRTLAGTVEVRAPHRQVADALLVNPGAALGLGWLFGSGDEIAAPWVLDQKPDGAAVSVRRERLTFAVRRIATYDRALRGSRASTVTIASGGSLLLVESDTTPALHQARVALGLTPTGGYRTVVRWHLTVAGPGGVAALVAARVALTRSTRAARRLEQAADRSATVADPAVDLIHPEPTTTTTSA